MKTITCTDFRKRVAECITLVEHGETIVLLRRGKPVAEVVPFTESTHPQPAWKRPLTRLATPGDDFSHTILMERETTP